MKLKRPASRQIAPDVFDNRNSDQKSREVLETASAPNHTCGPPLPLPARGPPRLPPHPPPTLGMRLAPWESWSPKHPSQGLLPSPQAALLWQERAGGQRIGFPTCQGSLGLKATGWAGSQAAKWRDLSAPGGPWPPSLHPTAHVRDWDGCSDLSPSWVTLREWWLALTSNLNS